MDNSDLLKIFNNLGYKYSWVKNFVFSPILEQHVALAGIPNSEDMLIIDVFGNPIDY
jgi:hypothetical protein